MNTTKKRLLAGCGILSLVVGVSGAQAALGVSDGSEDLTASGQSKDFVGPSADRTGTIYFTDVEVASPEGTADAARDAGQTTDEYVQEQLQEMLAADGLLDGDVGNGLDAAFAADALTLAQQEGMSLEHAYKDLTMSESFDQSIAKIEATHPESVAWTYWDSDSLTGSIGFNESVPAAAQEVLDSSAATIDIQEDFGRSRLDLERGVLELGADVQPLVDSGEVADGTFMVYVEERQGKIVVAGSEESIEAIRDYLEQGKTSPGTSSSYQGNVDFKIEDVHFVPQG